MCTTATVDNVTKHSSKTLHESSTEGPTDGPSGGVAALRPPQPSIRGLGVFLHLTAGLRVVVRRRDHGHVVHWHAVHLGTEGTVVNRWLTSGDLCPVYN